VTLVVPDPRHEPVPAGWWDQYARPLIEAVDEWDRLDEYEGLLRAYADLAVVLRADEFQFQAALRCVDAQRGELLGKAVRGRPPKSSARRGLPDDLSDWAKNTYRTIAEHWVDKVLPHLRAASRTENPREASQRRVLSLLPVEARWTPPDDGTLPTTFPTIVVDPPWEYENVATRNAAAKQYRTMSLDELRALAIPAAKDAHLYLWTTAAFLRDAFDLVEAWGFTYKTVLTWCKPQMGMGNYFRVNTEHVLFGVRGSLPTLRNNMGTWFAASRTRHSAKPDAFYDLVEVCSPAPWLEMFARRRRLGDWSYWGEEA
jgi:N6-adenosine-specific RNA methylase IME4